jgi:DNA-binding response OmpR family regulator
MPAPRILIVEDEQPLQALLCRVFSEERFHVATAGDGIECVNKVAGFRPDAVIMDLGLPRLDGLETTRLIRRNRDWSALVIVALSARADEQTRAAALEAGADLFVRKPFVMSRLVTRVQRLLDGRVHPS